MTGQLHTDTQPDRRKRKFSFFAYALLKKKKDKKEMPTLNFSSGFLSLPSFSTFAAYIFLCVEKFTHKKILATPPAAKELNSAHKTKTPAKKFSIALASWTVACILTAFLSADNCVGQIPQNPPLQQESLFDRANKQVEQSMFQNSPDWQRVQEMKMMRDNFPSLAPTYDQQINQTMQWYNPASHNYNNFSNSNNPNVPKVPNARDIGNQQNQNPHSAKTAQPGYDNPSAENNFNQMTPQMRMEREMVDLLKETQYNNSIVKSSEYYSSAQYLNDLPNYIKAKDNIKEMLEGKRKLSIKDAYFIAESAYGNLHLTYDEYNKLIKDNADFILKWVVENGYNPKDPEAIHLGIQKFLSDSLVIGKNNMDKMPPLNKEGHSPYYYDYLDVTSGKDRKNYFVTKTLATGSGQCHTFPVTYLILAEALGVEAHLAYNPVHSFVQYKNNKGTVVNYETTVDRFLPDPFYLQTLPVMATAQKNDIYINSLSKKQVVASVLFDLAVNFTLEHWLSDKKFIKECMNTATPYFPNQDFINTANDYLHKRLYADAFNNKVEEKGIRDINDIEKYPDVLEAYNNYRSYMEKVSKLGIQDFPESEYLRILEYYDYKGKLQIAKKIDAKSKKNLFFNK